MGSWRQGRRISTCSRGADFLGFVVIERSICPCAAAGRTPHRDRVKAFANHLARTNIPRSVAIQVDALYKAARIMLPKQDLAWLKSIKSRLHSAAPLKRAVGPAITSLQILQVGLSLMDDHAPEGGKRITLSHATAYRDGLMIALLAFAPIRRKNLASLEIGRHLVGEGTNRYLVIPASETKTQTPIEFAIPCTLVVVFRCLLGCCSSRLLRSASCRSLWIKSPRERAALRRHR